MNKQVTGFILVFVMFAFLFTGCKKDDDLVEKNGLTKEINDVISQDIIDLLDSLGMPINKGGNPPTIEGSYLSSPHVLYSSNRSGDIIGNIYNDLEVTFSNQNKKELTVTTGYTQSNFVFEGTGSFIVGDKNLFSVFVFDKEYQNYDEDSCLIARIFSGELTSNGISGLHTAITMLDDYGDPNDIYIEIGDTRVLYDQDGLSESEDAYKSAILKKLNSDSSK